jgi:hypothetical protein
LRPSQFAAQILAWNGRALADGPLVRWWLARLSDCCPTSDKYHALDYEDAGRSHFVVTEIGERVGEPMARWSARYTAETIKAQLQLATAMGGRMRTLELRLPLTFAASKFIWIAAGFYTQRRGAR